MKSPSPHVVSIIDIETITLINRVTRSALDFRGQPVVVYLWIPNDLHYYPFMVEQAGIALATPLCYHSSMTTKTCQECLREFKPSSNHKNCPRCRAVAAKKPCPLCGAPRGARYALCEPCRRSDQGMESNNAWKGGRIIKKGYILLRTPNHPKSKSNGGYVFENILVMEQHLGRNLFPGENVHHRNGIRDDNRIENLELWTKPQPSGIRVEDALAWAYHIIELYGSSVE